MRKITLLGALFALLSLGGIASANTLTWTLHGVSLSNGYTLSGSFDYDADTGTYTNVAVQENSGFTMNTVMHPQSGASFLEAIVSPLSVGSPVIELFFATSLTDAGGTVNLSSALYGSCSAVGGGFNCPSASTLGSSTSVGDVTAPTPEPATPALTGIAGLAFVATRLRKRYAR